MDIPRKNATRNRILRRIAFWLTVAVVVTGVTIVTSRLKPAAPEVDAATIWPGAVQRGEMLLEVNGLGTLVPEEIWQIPAPYPGRVEKIAELPGAKVSADTVLMVLTNPDMEQQVREAQWSLLTGQADLANLKAQNASQRVSQASEVETLQAQYRDAKAKNDRDDILYKEGLELEYDYRISKGAVDDLAERIKFAQEKGKALNESLDAQLKSKEAQVNQLEAMLALRREQLDELKVRAGVAGILQQVEVQVGQQVGGGTNLAIVVEPHKLKAQLAIPETQAKDVLLNQKATIDTQNGIIPGHVSRIDPSVINGTRTVDVKLDGPLPPGAVPDKSVDGTIEIMRLENVLYMNRPVNAQAGGEISLFKISPDGKEATKVKVKLGRTSVNTVEILSGLKLGDKVILSDMSAQDNYDRIRLK